MFVFVTVSTLITSKETESSSESDELSNALTCLKQQNIKAGLLFDELAENRDYNRRQERVM